MSYIASAPWALPSPPPLPAPAAATLALASLCRTLPTRPKFGYGNIVPKLNGLGQLTSLSFGPAFDPCED